MNKNFVITTLLIFLFVSAPVFADVVGGVVAPGFFLGIFTLFVTLLEAVIFWLLMNRWVKTQTNFYKSILVVFIANIVTTLLGIVFRPLIAFLANTSFPSIFDLVLCFVISALVEWLIYIPFFRKAGVRYLDLFVVSLIVNLASYVVILMFWPSWPYVWSHHGEIWIP